MPGTRYIRTGEGDSSDHLNEKSRQRGAAEDVKPPRLPGLRDRMCQRRPRAFEVPVISSNQAHRRLRELMAVCSSSGRDRHRARFDLDQALVHAHGICAQCLGRRPGSDISIGIKHAPMTRAHEKICRRNPAHRTTQVGAVDRECDKFMLVFAAQPCGGLRGYTRPGQGRRIGKRNRNRLPNLEIVDPPKRTPDRRRLTETQQECDGGNGHNRGGNSGCQDANLREKGPPFLLAWLSPL